MNQEKEEKIRSTIIELFQKTGHRVADLGISPVSLSKKTDEKTQNKGVMVNVQLADEEVLVLGRKEDAFQSFEHLARLLVNRQLGEGETVYLLLDVNNRRKERAEKLALYAQKVAVKVKETQKSEVLFPMSSYDRRIIHLNLASDTGVLTESIGTTPNRRVVVRPYP